MKIPIPRRLASLLLALVCLLPGPAAAEEVQITDQARRHFEAGVNYLQDPEGARYEEAYREFKAAYAESPSWKITGNLGLCAMKLERDAEAIEAFEKYLTEGGDQIDAEERAQFRRDLQTLKASVVSVDIESVPPGAVVTDERIPVTGPSVVNRYGPLNGPVRMGIRAGHHRMTARLAGHPDLVWEFDAASGSEHKRTFEFSAADETPGASAAGNTAASNIDASADELSRPVPTGVYIGLALTGALAVGAGVTGYLALSKKSDFDDANDGTDPARAEELRDSGQTLNLITDVLLGGAVVAAGVTAVLYLTRPTEPQRDTTALRAVPVVTPNTAALTLSGSF